MPGRVEAHWFVAARAGLDEERPLPGHGRASRRHPRLGGLEVGGRRPAVHAGALERQAVPGERRADGGVDDGRPDGGAEAPGSRLFVGHVERVEGRLERLDEVR